MDYFDFDTIENYICKSKSNIKERLKNITLNERNHKIHLEMQRNQKVLKEVYQK